MNSKNELYGVGKKIGLNKEEIDEVIQKASDTQLTDSKKLLLKHSSDEYFPGTMYGTVSIHNIHRLLKLSKT